MQWKHAALAALLASATYVGVDALRRAPEDPALQSAADPASAPLAQEAVAEEAVAEEAVTEEAVAEAAVAEAAVAEPAVIPTEPAAEPDPTEMEVRLAAAEAERDRLRLELDLAAAERDALAETLAAREAEAAAAPPGPETPVAAGTDAAVEPPAVTGTETDPSTEPTAEIVRLLADLAAQAAEIDRLKAELTARDDELAAMRETAEILPLPVRPETPSAVLVVAPEPGAASPADAAAAALFAARLEAAKSGLPLPRPVAPVAAVATPGQAPLALVLFERGSATLTTGGADRASEAAAALTAVGAGRIRVTGHSDTTGSPNANMRLSRARAEAVAAALIEAGLPADRIEIAPHGQAPEALPIPTGVGVAEPLNRCAGIFMLASAE